jgi:hypothetical protein
MSESYTSRAVILGAAFCILSAAAVYAGWNKETVASAGDVGEGCSLAVDRWGRPHISYVDKTQSKVMYARYTGSTWEFETVASDVNVIRNTALDLDSFDRPHVLFSDINKQELTYAYKSGSTWVKQQVEAGVGLGYYLSINVLGSTPRVTYIKQPGSTASLRYAYRESGTWTAENATGVAGGYSNTLIVDSSDRPRVVFATTDTVIFATRSSSGWTYDSLAAGTDPDAFLGPDDMLHVSFADVDNSRLNYAVAKIGSSWKFENIKEAVGEPAFTQITVNAAGDVFISYFNFSNHNLRVVYKQGGTWTPEVVATGAYVGLPNSMAMGGNGYPLIAFYDSDNGDLKLARYVISDIELDYFVAARAHGAVQLHWAAAEGQNLAGFNLYRAAPEGERVKVNAELITGASPFRYRDAGARADAAYEYWLEAVTLGGAAETFGPARVPAASKGRAFALYQNVPNPCTAAATFAFELAEATDVTLVIYDITGRKVDEAAKGWFPAGRHEIPFELTLPPGVYVYRLDAGGESAARKMVVAR